MKSPVSKFTYFVLLLLPLIASHRLMAQQNLFNIPSADLTPKNRAFFQHQTNIYRINDLESKNHFVYGLGGGFEMGVNVINLKMNFRPNAPFFTQNDGDQTKPLKPLVQLTAQKFFSLPTTSKPVLVPRLGVRHAGSTAVHA